MISFFTKPKTNQNPNYNQGSRPKFKKGKKEQYKKLMPDTFRFGGRRIKLNQSKSERHRQAQAVADYHRITLRKETTKKERQAAHFLLMSRPEKPVFE